MTTNNSWNSAYPAAVPQGGTGDSSLTAYGSLCGGTSTTSPIQVVSPGTAGYIYAANGATALPSWVPPGSVGGKTFISSQIATSGQATVDFPNVITSAFEIFQLDFDNLSPLALNGYLGIIFGTGSTPTYQSSGYQGVVTIQSSTLYTGMANYTSATTYMALSDLDSGLAYTSGGSSPNAGFTASGSIIFGNLNSSTQHANINSTMTYLSRSAVSSAGIVAGATSYYYWTGSGPVTSFRFLWSGGPDFYSGNFYLYGLATS